MPIARRFPPQDDDERPNANATRRLAGASHYGDDLLDRGWICRIAASLFRGTRPEW
jgi:hypothetical protein